MGITQPAQFIGYWGNAIQSEAEDLLGQVLITQKPNQIKRYQGKLDIRSEGNSLIWGVAYIGSSGDNFNSNLFDQGEEITFSLSATGLEDQPEIWVKLQGISCILGREPLGRLPLYWTELSHSIWFASRLQLLLPLRENYHLSIPAIYGYSCFSYVPTPLSPIENILAIAAGTEVKWVANNPTERVTTKLHQWQQAPELIKHEEEAIFQLQNLLKAAINRQIADLTNDDYGIFLSGGIDSSIVAALLVQAGIKIRAYTLDFEPILRNKNTSELPYAQQVADFLKIPLIKVTVTPDKLRKALIPTVQALDLPFGDGATLPLFLLTQVASQETALIFNGENGDQLFAGWTNKPLIAAGIYNQENPAGFKDFNRQYLDTFGALSGYESICFQREVLRNIQTINPIDWLAEALDPQFCTDWLAKLRRATLMLKGAQNIQPRANNLAMSQGLRVRSPFCDFPLTEWSFQLPGEFCLQGACEKYILKKAVASWLPPEIVWREKQGMAVPVTTLCLNELRRDVRKWLSRSRLREQGIWNPDFSEQIISGKVGGLMKGGRVGRNLWLLLMWQVWYSAIFGERSSSNFFKKINDLFYDLVD